MCQQFIGTAQCAPISPPGCGFTFHCGQLHHYADQHKTCEDVKGECVCFFGTCGSIENVVHSLPFDLLALKRIRCLPCTEREEQAGDRRDGRELLETHLLTRSPVSDEGMPDYAKILMERWGGQTECPFHELIDDGSTKASSSDGAAEQQSAHDGDIATSKAAGPAEQSVPEWSISIESANDDHDIPENKDEQDEGVQRKADMDDATGLPAVVKQASISPNDSTDQTDNIPANTRDPSETSVKDLDDTTFTKPMQGIEASRWAPAGTGCKETLSPAKSHQQEERGPHSSPRPYLFKTAKIEPGKTAMAGIAKDMKSFLGL